MNRELKSLDGHFLAYNSRDILLAVRMPILYNSASVRLYTKKDAQLQEVPFDAGNEKSELISNKSKELERISMRVDLKRLPWN